MEQELDEVVTPQPRVMVGFTEDEANMVIAALDYVVASSDEEHVHPAVTSALAQIKGQVEKQKQPQAAEEEAVQAETAE